MSNISNKTIEKLKYDLVRNNLVSFDDLNLSERLESEKDKNLTQILI